MTQTIKPDIYKHVDDRRLSSSNIVRRKQSSKPHGTGPIAVRIWRSTEKAARSELSKRIALRFWWKAKTSCRCPLRPILAPENDFLAYVKAVVRRETKADGLSSFENNMIVTEILDAARRSARSGSKVRL